MNLSQDYAATIQNLRENNSTDYHRFLNMVGAGVGAEISTGPQELITGGYKLYPYNPDDLVVKKGLEIYDEMKKDDQVKPALFIKKLGRLSGKWQVKPASKKARDVEIAKFYEDTLKEMPGTFIKTMLGLMTCLDYGYSISEVVLKYLENGKHKGKIGLKAIKSRKPHDFEFKADEHSNLEKLIQYQNGISKELPPNKFIIWSWNPEWENWYGVSDLKAAYRPWWMKDVVTKFHGIFLERYPSPVFIGRYPQGLAEKEKTALLNALEDLQIKTSTIVPQGVVVDTIEVGKSGSAIYDKAIEKFDKQICRSILVPDLLGMSNTPSKGSYALGRKHFDVFLWVLYHLGKTTEEMLHEQLTIPLIDLNYQVDEYPRFVMEEITEESMETKAKILVQLTQAGLVDFNIPEYRKWASEFLYALPDVDTKAAAMASDALTFSDEQFKFYSPDNRDFFTLDIAENAARMEKFEDALSIG